MVSWRCGLVGGGSCVRWCGQRWKLERCAGRRVTRLLWKAPLSNQSDLPHQPARPRPKLVLPVPPIVTVLPTSATMDKRLVTASSRALLISHRTDISAAIPRRRGRHRDAGHPRRPEPHQRLLDAAPEAGTPPGGARRQKRAQSTSPPPPIGTRTLTKNRAIQQEKEYLTDVA